MASSTNEAPNIPNLKHSSFICLDTGRRTGWAYRTRDGKTDSGVHELYDTAGNKKNYEDGERFEALRTFVDTLAEQIGGVDFIAFEQVNGGTKGRQTPLFNGYRATLLLWAIDNEVPAIPITVQFNKKAATGSGGASKAQMMRACADIDLPPFDDNEADAIAMREFALPQLRKEQQSVTNSNNSETAKHSNSKQKRGNSKRHSGKDATTTAKGPTAANRNNGKARKRQKPSSIAADTPAEQILCDTSICGASKSDAAGLRRTLSKPVRKRSGKSGADTTSE